MSGAVKISSFQKKSTRKNAAIDGTKPSLSNNQLMISTGVPSLDNLLGGGLAVGSVLLIEEDEHCSYGKLLLRYFIAEGVVHKHDCFVASAECEPDSILQELPAPVQYTDRAKLSNKQENMKCDYQNTTSTCCDSTRPCNVDGTSDQLQIAWRYKHMPLPEVESTSQFGYHFDLSQTLSSESLEAVNSTCFNPLIEPPQEDSVDLKQCYSRLLHSLNCVVNDGKYLTSSDTSERHILRIGIHMLGSALWGDAGWNCKPVISDRSADISLCHFLYSLRSVARSSYTACFVTVPVCMFEAAQQARLEHLSDAVIRLESFVGTAVENDPTFKEYNGTFHVVKLPKLNTFTTPNIDTADLAFKVRRKRFTIEKYHLPPAIADNENSNSVEKSQQLLIARSTGGCVAGQTTSKHIDF